MSYAALPTLRTPRLTLRPLQMTDAPAIVEGVGNFDVSKWLSSLPYPYEREDADYFLTKTIESESKVWAICDDAGFVGAIGLDEELGYWLARPAWGKGYGFESALAVVAHVFANPKTDEMTSGYFAGNERSAAVLRSLGFKEFGVERREAKSLSQDVDAIKMRLTRARWEKRQRFQLDTRNLSVRPLVENDAEEIQWLGAVETARNLASVPLNWTMEASQRWIYARIWRGYSGFVLAITKGARVIGILGCGGSPVSIMFAVRPEMTGQGVATEALSAFASELFDRFPVSQIVAERFEDNPASGAVLQKVGFVETGRAIAHSKARLEPAPVITYALTRNAFKDTQ